MSVSFVTNFHNYSFYRDKTPENTAFSGSMQLLAGVKLSTNHPITNHPHYEDKELRKRTREVHVSFS